MPPISYHGGELSHTDRNQKSLDLQGIYLSHTSQKIVAMALLSQLAEALVTLKLQKWDKNDIEILEQFIQKNFNLVSSSWSFFFFCCEEKKGFWVFANFWNSKSFSKNDGSFEQQHVSQEFIL